MNQQKLSLVYVTILLLESSFNQPTLAQSNDTTPLSPETMKLEALPKPPETPPDNNTRPGGGLDPNNQQSCNSQNQSLGALIPLKNPIYTISDKPTFLFYIPDISSNINYIQFSLNNKDEENIYRDNFTVPETPGIVSLTLPSLSSDQFSNDQYYHWYFKVYCANNNSEKSNFYVDGWLYKIEKNFERELLLEAGDLRIWYDSSNYLYQQLFINSDDNLLRENWRNLLEFIKQEDLINQELSGELKPISY